ncbi:MAG TPA: 2-dehydropantoate 2-reductase [Bryobacteraceae bacterium]|jgi:2-dehydropantoate 2-reductase
MRILVVGAGAVGGYFGGRLLEARRDVTFLVRPRRAAELQASGLRIHSRQGDVHLPLPPTVVADDLNEPFDLILLSCKAYDLAGAIASFAPAVGPDTVIVPLLNGMRHIDILGARFGPAVLGGRCLISSTLNERREIVHFSDIHSISFGELNGAVSKRVRAIERLFDGARCDGQGSPHIVLEMWEKWVFIATLAGATCLMRSTIGDICSSPGGQDFVLRLFEECRTVAATQGFAPRDTAADRSLAMVTAANSTLTASMLRDIEMNGAIEADQIVGDLLDRAVAPLTLLPVVYTALKAYEHHRAASSRSTAAG